MSGRLILLVLGAFVVIVSALLAAGAAPATALSELVQGSLGSPRAIAGTLRESTPLLLAGVAVYLALRAGLFNIGAEGQFLVGALVSAWIGLNIPGHFGIVLGLMGGCVAGALWALPAAWIKAYRGGHEVISTIMLNNIAAYFSLAIVAGPLKGPGQESPTTAYLDDATRMPALIRSSQIEVNSSLVLGLIGVVCLTIWLRRTVSGYELSAVGANATAAQVAGIEVRSVLVRAMVCSGSLAGLAGALQVLSFEGRFYQGFSSGYGFDALGVALLAGGTPWGIIPSSLAFGVLNKGMVSVQLLGVPRGLSSVLLGLLIVVFAAYRYRRRAAVA